MMTTPLPRSLAAPLIHRLYGIDIRTPWRLSGVPGRAGGPWDVEFVQGDPAALAAARAHVPAAQAQWWAQQAALPDGSVYRCWKGLFEFVVTADARQIHARLLNDAFEEALLGYLVVDALSLSMVRLGREPLHATAVLTDRGVVAFLGESGAGKSTTAAFFLRQGFRLVTDDMLALSVDGEGFVAQAGPPRLKLYRDIAVRIFGSDRDGVPMNPVTEKLIIRLDEKESVREPHPVAALYVLAEDGAGVVPGQPTIRRLSPAEALPRVLASTAAHYPSERERLRRQFDFVTRLVRRVPVSTLSCRGNGDEIADVRDAVLADLA